MRNKPQKVSAPAGLTSYLKAQWESTYRVYAEEVGVSPKEAKSCADLKVKSIKRTQRMLAGVSL